MSSQHPFAHGALSVPVSIRCSSHPRQQPLRLLPRHPRRPLRQITLQRRHHRRPADALSAMLASQRTCSSSSPRLATSSPMAAGVRSLLIASSRFMRSRRDRGEAVSGFGADWSGWLSADLERIDADGARMRCAAVPNRSGWPAAGGGAACQAWPALRPQTADGTPLGARASRPHPPPRLRPAWRRPAPPGSCARPRGRARPPGDPTPPAPGAACGIRRTAAPPSP